MSVVKPKTRSSLFRQFAFYGTCVYMGVILAFSILPVSRGNAAGPTGYTASDVIGEFNAMGGNYLGPTNQYGLWAPTGMSTDSVHHLLWVTDGGYYYNNRVVAYPLSNTDQVSGTAASYVLGEPDFTTSSDYASTISQNTMGSPTDTLYDPGSNLLFVADQFNNRVLVYDFSGGISNNMNAKYVLGQNSFTTGTAATTQSGLSQPSHLAYDPLNKLLFVTDYANDRVMVFDLSSGVSTGMNASYVLGQPNFTTSGTGQWSIDDTRAFNKVAGVVYDSADKYLFVSDGELATDSRILVFNLSGGIVTNMAASNALGVASTSATGSSFTPASQSTFVSPDSMAWDPANKRLFVGDNSAYRVMVFDLSGGVSNGMNASFELGQATWSGQNFPPTTTASSIDVPSGIAYDSVSSQLFVGDVYDNRVMDFDMSGAVSNDMNASHILGQTDLAGNPSFTYNTANDFAHFANQYVLTASGTVVDSVHHRLFVADSTGTRVMVYGLDSGNNLVSHTAINVLGEPDFEAQATGVTQSQLTPSGLAYDPNRNWLFVADTAGSRVMVYDLSSGIVDGMNATYVLGEPNFTTSTCLVTQTTICGPQGGVAFDPATNLLYVSDGSNNRVMVFNTTTGTIASGMPATYVIGQPNFTTTTKNITQNGLSSPYGMAIDSARHELFVSDWGGGGPSRVLVYDTSAIATNMNASNVIGESSFTSANSAVDTGGPTDNQSFGPEGLAYDPNNQRLFVEDVNSNRILTYDLAGGISPPMTASAVIGQPDFVTANYDTVVPNSADFGALPTDSDYFDPTTNRLYSSDNLYGRVMIFSFAKLATINTTPSVGTNYSQVLGSQTQGSVTYAITSGSLPTGLNLNLSTGLLSGTTTTAGLFNFTVQLTDNNGSTGSISDTKAYSVNVGGGGGSPPTAPTNLTATPNSPTSVSLSWGASTSSVGIASYSIYRNGSLLTSVAGNTLIYTDNSVSPATSYSYYVTATDISSANSPPSNTAFVTTPSLPGGSSSGGGSSGGSSPDTKPPTAPTLTAVLGDGNTANLSWTKSTDNVGVAHYKVYEDGKLVTVTGPGTTSYSIPGLTPGQTYTFNVTAADSAGNVSAASNTASVIVPLPVTISSVPSPSPSGSPILTFRNHNPHGSQGSPNLLLVVLTGLANAVFKIPPIDLHLFPWILFVLLAIITRQVIHQWLKEVKELKVLKQFLEKATLLDDAKRTFIGLVSHYFRTPLTQILGGIDLIGIDKHLKVPLDIISNLKTAATSMHDKTEELILGAQTLQANTAEDVGSDLGPVQVWRQPALYVPVLAIGGVWVIFLFLVRFAGSLTFSQVELTAQILVFIILSAALYIGVRGRQLVRRDRRAADDIYASREAIWEARDKVIADAVSSLTSDLKTLEDSAGSLDDSTSKHSVVAGLKTLREILKKFAVATSLVGVRSRRSAEDTKLESLVSMAKMRLKPGLQSRAQSIQFSGSDFVVQEPKLVAFVVATLLDNALSYSKEGTVVSVSSTATHKGVTITVSDHGSGIDSTKQSLLFQPFSKVEGAEDFNHEGMGFELYLDKLIMLYLGGDIALTSTKYQGTTVTLNLPSLSPSAQPNPFPVLKEA